MPISVDFEQQLRGPWDTASGFLIDQLELLQAQLAPIIAAASANSATYDEGTWTPTITGSSGGSGQTYSVQQGTYIKVGKSVTVTCYVSLTAKGTITGYVIIGGLPFPSRVSGYFISAIRWNNTVTLLSSMTGQVMPGTTYIAPLAVAGAGSGLGFTLSTSDIGNTTGFLTTVTYFTP